MPRNPYDPALFIEGRDRFGARRFPAARPNGRNRHIAVDHSDRRFDHRATIVALRDDAVGMVGPISGDGDFRPLDWLVSARRIGEHIAVTLVILANDDDAGLVGFLAAAGSGIHSYDDALQIRHIAV